MKERVKEYWDQKGKGHMDRAKKRYRDAKLRHSAGP